MVKEPGCKKRPKPLAGKHSDQSDKAEKWGRRRWQFHQAKDNTNCKAGTECEKEGASRNRLITHLGVSPRGTPLPPKASAPGIKITLQAAHLAINDAADAAAFAKLEAGYVSLFGLEDFAKGRKAEAEN
jgi:hypothetical protein